jgi:coenzyme Q-binding protein COQ10
MPQFDVERVTDHPIDLVHEVVADVENYPEFLPGWKAVEATPLPDGTVEAYQTVGVKGVTRRFRSVVVSEAPTRVHVTSRDKPFKRLDQVWRFEEVATGRTRVALTVDYKLSELLLKPIFSAVYEEALQKGLSAFERRAAELARERGLG